MEEKEIMQKWPNNIFLTFKEGNAIDRIIQVYLYSVCLRSYIKVS